MNIDYSALGANLIAEAKKYKRTGALSLCTAEGV